MLFCKSSLVSGSSEIGNTSDCSIFVINFIGVLWIAILAYRFVKKDAIFTSGTLREPLVLQRFGEETDRSSQSNPEKHYKIVPTVVAVVCLLESLFSIVAAIIAITGGFDDCNAIGFYISFIFRIAGWIAVAYLVSIFPRNTKHPLYAGLGWGITQVLSSGMNAVRSGTSEPTVGFAIVILIYFLLSIFLSVTWSYKIFRLDSTRDVSLFSFFSRFSYLGSDVKKPDSEVKSNPSRSSTNVVPNEVDFKSVWANRTNNASFSEQNSRANSQDLADVRISITSADSEDQSVERKTWDMASTPSVDYGISRSMSAGSTNSHVLSQPALSSSIPTPSSAMRFRERILGSTNDVTVSVVDWEKVNINGKQVVIYKLGVGESKSNDSMEKGGSNTNMPRTVRIIMKRFDEIVYLREKILSDFPHLLDIPSVPEPGQTVVAVEESEFNNNNNKRMGSSEYETHRRAMTKYLEHLVTHPVASRLAIFDIRGNVNNTGIKKRPGLLLGANVIESEQSQSAIQSSNDKTKLNGDSKATEDQNGSVQALPMYYPLLLQCNRFNFEVDVTGWTDVQSSRKESKIYYEVDVRYKDNSWVIRKRFRQFRALFYALESQHIFEGVPISYPTKYSQKRGKAVSPSREEESQLNENTLSLDCFLKSCLQNLQTYPPILLAFLESDVSRRSYGFDAIKNSDGKFEFVRTAESNLQSRQLKIEKYDKVTIKIGPNVPVMALNLIEESVTTGNRLFGMLRSSDVAPETTNLANEDVDVRINPFDDGSDSAMDGEDESRLAAIDSGDENEQRPSLTSNITSNNTNNATTTRKSGIFHRHKDEANRDQQLSLPAVILGDLIGLVQLFRGCEMVDEASSELHYLPSHFLAVIDSKVKPNISDEGYRGDGNEIDPVFGRGLWLSQWRVRNAMLSTTAFAEINKASSSIKGLLAKDLKDLQESVKMAYLLNLYNLISLHGSIMLLWPHVEDRKGRVNYTKAAKYRVGNAFLSLLQIEHALLRARSKPLSLPSIPGSVETPIPTPNEVKTFAGLSLSQAEPRVSFALSLPFRSSSVAFVYYPGHIADELKLSAAFNIFTKLTFVKGGVVLPKVMRRYVLDFASWRDIAAVIPDLKSDTIDVSGNAPQLSPLRYITASPAPHLTRCQSTNIASATPKPEDPINRLIIDKNDADDKDKETAWDLAEDLAGNWTLSKSVVSNATASTSSQSANNGTTATSKVSVNHGFGDVPILEDELERISRLLKIGVDIRDRRSMLKSYKNAFLGSEAVKCFLASGQAKTTQEAQNMGDLLIEYGIIQHVTSDHWLKDQDLLYTFTGYNAPQAQVSPYFAFLSSHVPCVEKLEAFKDMEFSNLKKQLQSALDCESKVIYGAEDFSFAFPIPELK